jgi:hypothetical protein
VLVVIGTRSATSSSSSSAAAAPVDVHQLLDDVVDGLAIQGRFGSTPHHSMVGAAEHAARWLSGTTP